MLILLNLIWTDKLVNRDPYSTDANVTDWQGVSIPGAAMIEDDGGGNGRWTQKALEQSPTGAGNAIEKIDGGTVVSANTTTPGAHTITLGASAPAVDGALYLAELDIISGPGAGQRFTITNYSGVDKICTVYPDIIGGYVPDNTSEYQVVGTESHITSQKGAVINNLVSGTVDSNVTHWQAFAIPGTAMIENDGLGDGRWTQKALEEVNVGASLTQQDVADAMRLTPVGTVQAGSVDDSLANLLTGVNVASMNNDAITALAIQDRAFTTQKFFLSRWVRITISSTIYCCYYCWNYS